MPTITESDVRFAGRAALAKAASRGRMSPDQALRELNESQPTSINYDIFLSHSFKDAELILGIRDILLTLGHRAYVDWIDDPALDRTKVTSHTAAVLRTRMQNCRSLFFATTDNYSSSNWMPWECGFFDGKNGRCAILPVTKTAQDTYTGQEYLGIYPYVQKRQDFYKKDTLFIHETPKRYIRFSGWLSGEKMIDY